MSEPGTGNSNLLQEMYLLCADIDDKLLAIELRDNPAPSSRRHHRGAPSSAADVSDASLADRDAASSDRDTHDSVVGVSTQCRPHSDDSTVISKTQSAVELPSADDHSGTHQHSAAINLLLWKLTELERRITVVQARDAAESAADYVNKHYSNFFITTNYSLNYLLKVMKSYTTR